MPRMKIGEFEFEGTVEELAALKHAIQQPKVEEGSAQATRAHVSQGDEGFVDEATALAILTRRPLSSVQIKVLLTLYDAASGWTSATELQKRTKYSTSEFAGLMGAFGRRVAYTEGVGERKFFDQVWDANLGCNRYRLPNSVRLAVERSSLELIG